MKYAKEVIDLMACYPGRQFRMIEIIRYVDSKAVGMQQRRVRNGVLRVLQSLAECGSVIVRAHGARGHYATYAWKSDT